MPARARKALFVFLLLTLILTGCVTLPDLNASQEQSSEGIALLDTPEQVFEQTLVSNRPRMNSITVWLGSSEGIANTEVSLYALGGKEDPIFKKILPVQAPGPQTLSFLPQGDPPGQAYILRIRTLTGSAWVYGANVDAYTKGSATLAGDPLPGDAAFRLTYDYNPVSVFADILWILKNFALALPLFAVLIAPGWLLLDFLGLRRWFDPGERMALSAGLSLSILPVIMLWTSTVNVPWSATAVRIGALILLAVLIWRWFPRQREKLFSGWKVDWITILLGGVLLLALGVRIAMIRDLAAPPWVDSVHHALLTRLILLQGGFPDTLQPYFNLPPTEYHLGYHGTLASFLWLSGLEIPEGMLLYGQVLNALTAAGAYLLTTSLTGNRKAALVAAAIAGLFTPMPAYYTSWGRYTQLAGLVILPAAIAFLTKLTERNEDEVGHLYHLPLFAGLTVALGGTMLVHYRVAAFTILLMGTWLISQVRFSKPALLRWVRIALEGAVLPTAAAVSITLPWTLPNFLGLLLPSLGNGGGSGGQFFSDFSWSFLKPALGTVSLVLAGLGLALALWKGKRFALALILWVAGMFFLANFGALGLPLASFVNNTSVAITLFLPIAALGGYLCADIFDFSLLRLPLRWKIPATLLFVGIGAGLLVFASVKLLPILNPVTVQFREGDRPAMTWIDQNLPEDAVVLINPFNWGYGIYTGTDGGAWIEPLTGRRTLPPPVLYGFGEKEDIDRIVSFSQAVIEKGGDPEALWGLMEANGIEYVYTGVKGGPILPSALLKSARFEVVYAEAGAFVFRRVP